jgi:hypothetical protein
MKSAPICYVAGSHVQAMDSFANSAKVIYLLPYSLFMAPLSQVLGAVVFN